MTKKFAAAILFCMLWAAGTPAQQSTKYWIYFSDKDMPPAMFKKGTMEATEGRAYISDRAIRRREKTLPPGSLIDEADLPVKPEYIRAIESQGVKIENVLRWFNAVTAYLTPDNCREITSLPFVRKVVPVASIRRSPEFPVTPLQGVNTGGLGKTAIVDNGQATPQLTAVNIIQLQRSGDLGDSAIIGMLDTGFRWRTNDALKNTRVIAENDFIFKDGNTANQLGDDPAQDEHGTMTLSILAANSNGVYVGAAPNASFILAKTEDIRSEHKVEEDNWAAAIEWMEGLGADVVSSSLGYSTFDPPDQSYSWANGDFNGRTTITAQAAIMAARKGVLVVNAMGNAGNGNGVVGTLDTPADADSILAVGAVTYMGADSGSLASFSSTGPTNDGRIKPDVVAPGVSTVVLNPTGYFVTGSGTSFATPIVAGAAALLISGHPGATAMQVRDALRNTANNTLEPDNEYGWGEINAWSAHQYLDSGYVPPPVLPKRMALFQNYPNPAIGGTTIRFDIPGTSHTTLSIYSVLGQNIRTLFDGNEDRGRYELKWDGKTGRGIAASSGVYFIVLRSSGSTKTMKMILLH